MSAKLLRIARWPSLILALSGLPFVLWAVVHISSNTTDMSQWVPENRVVKTQYDWFVKQFGIDDFVLVSWPGCRRGDDRIAQLQQLLSHATESTAWPNEQATPFQDVVTGPELTEEVERFSRSSRQAATEKLRGIFWGPEDHTCVMGSLSEAGRANPAGVVAFVRERANQVGIGDDVKLGGSVCQVTAIDTESMRSMRMLAPLSGIVALLIAAMCLRDLRLTLIGMAISGYAAGISLALIFYSGYALNGMMTVLPTLAFVLTLSGAVHLLNYYRDSWKERHDDAAAVDLAMQAGWAPCAIAVATSSLGMASLGTSGLRPVREFGVFAAISLLLGLALLLTVLPACLQLSSRWWPHNQAARKTRKTSNAFANAAAGIIHRHTAVMILGLVTLAVTGYGLRSIQSSVRLERMFRPGYRLVEDYQWLEREVAPLSAVEVVLRFDERQPLTVSQQLELVTAVHDACSDVPEVASVFSAASFVPSVSHQRNARSTMQRSVLRTKIERSFATFQQQSLAARDSDDAALWRVSARVPAMQSPDYEQLIGDLTKKIDALPRPAGCEVESLFTGSYPLIDDSQEVLLQDLAKSFALAFVFILPVMIVTLRSLAMGMLAMLPNVAPIVIVFGAMGWLNVPIDIGIILTASVALGIAVDDTVHFLTWYQRAIASGSTIAAAVKHAFVRCAPAMVQTTVICGLGVLVFSASTFAPAGRFAVLLSMLLVAALFGDLLMLPALLVSCQSQQQKLETPTPSRKKVLL